MGGEIRTLRVQQTCEIAPSAWALSRILERGLGHELSQVGVEARRDDGTQGFGPIRRLPPSSRCSLAPLSRGGDCPEFSYGVAGPPTKHQLALMIWLAVFPTLTVLNLALGDWLRTLTPVLPTLVLASIAVPIVSTQ